MAQNDSFDIGPGSGGVVDEAGGADGDAVTETSTESLGQRLMGALTGILIGFVLLAGSTIGLFWNEGRAVQTARALTEGSKAVVSVDAGRIDPALADKLIHISGPLEVAEPLNDPLVGVSQKAVKLIRTVEMFQWVEEQETNSHSNVGGSRTTTTTYRYHRQWVDHPVNSANFHQPGNHRNPPMPVSSAVQQLQSAKLGAFTLDRTILSSLSNDSKLPLEASNAAAMRAALATTKPVSVVDGVAYVTQDTSNPTIGDLRISLAVVPAGEASVVGRQSGTSLSPYIASNGRQVLLVDPGRVSAAVMFKEAQDDNTIITWIIRFVGTVVMFIGFRLLFGPIEVLADILPILGSVVGFGLSLIALIATCVLAPATIAIAWFWYRPLLALLIVAGGGVIVYLLMQRGRARQASSQPSGAAA